MATLAELRTKRGSIKARLTKFYNYLTSLKEINEIALLQLEIRLTKIEPLFDEFNVTQINIELLDKESTTHDDERDAFENSYFEVVARSNKLIRDNNKKPETARSCPTGVLHDSENSQFKKNVRLPALELKSFNGAYENWVSFYDTFRSLIHDDPDLPDVQKFHYLKSSLKGDALRLIDSLPVTTINYTTAWQLLRDRYDSKQLIINHHVKALLSTPTLSKESLIGLRQLLTNTSTNLSALKALDQPVDQWSTLLVHIISQKLDSVTFRDWEGANECNPDIPTMAELTEFLETRCRTLERCSQNKQILVESRSLPKRERIISNLATSSTSCTSCGSNHSISSCSAFLDLPIQDRILRARELRLCINCLQKGHSNRICKSSRCKKCRKSHNTLLHLDINNVQAPPLSPIVSNISKPAPTSNSETNQDSTVLSHTVCGLSTHCILSTVIINVRDNKGNLTEVRALLDSGSESSFISEGLCAKLNVPKSKVSISVTGINQIESKISYKTVVNVRSRINAFNTDLNCFTVPRVTGNIPSATFDRSLLNIPGDIKLADPTFHISNNIDLLIGADLFWNVLCTGQIRLGRNKPILHKTLFGWVLAGPMSFVPPTISASIKCNFTMKTSIEDQLAKFWEVEELQTVQPLSITEKLCEDNFVKTTIRDTNGRFTVTIPFNQSISRLGESRQSALNRFLSLERKLEKNRDLKLQYVSFMKEYEDLGHMKKIDERDPIKGTCYYFPHHAVIKDTSLSTRLRVVFDGSAPTSTGLSINDAQLVGPTIQDDLLAIILRFRKHPFVLVADIAKMYRQILINPNQRSLQRILWRDNPTAPISCYELSTVTYGTSSAPFLAIRCLHQVAQDNIAAYPVASAIILKDFYVDDLLTGANSIEELQLIKSKLIHILSAACFQLRKWRSNSPELVGAVENNSELLQIGDFDAKALGLWWNSSSDIFKFSIETRHPNQSITKRMILSTTAQIFDPLGILGPVTVIAKSILQKLWSLKIDWDESLPCDLHTKWIQFQNGLQSLNNLIIPRHVMCKNPIEIQLHGFSDASEMAYGACIYIRTMDANGDVHVSLLCAKSRVAPLKNLNIPRLELCGALLLASLFDKVVKSLNLTFHSVYFWTDSTIVLGWLNKSSNIWKTFVANRVAQIQTLTEIIDWHHVRSSDNPADLISRGVYPQELLSSSLWWSGPSWLLENHELWPALDNNLIRNNDLPEFKLASPNVLSIQISGFDLFERYSSLGKLQRVTAYCLRFKNNCLNKDTRLRGALTTNELNNSLNILIKLCQTHTFMDEQNHLITGKPLRANSRLLTLHPFIDTLGLMRVGGRLLHSNFDVNKKHPIVLPAKHPFTLLIVRHEHIRLLHAGPQALLASLRERFWPLSGPSLCKKVVNKCIHCFRVRPTNTEPIMGDLPKSRITPTRPFLVCGVDYAGPYTVKDRKNRGCKTSKAYLCIFVCFSTKAVHIELAPDLSTDSFLNVFKRFTARRGYCTDIYSDNGTNFVGANNALSELNQKLQNDQVQNDLLNYITEKAIRWHFIPARSPTFGGLWEAAVKSAKNHIKRVIGDTILTFEQLYTILTQVESCLNSRPLTPLSSDPSDFSVLTPGHFLIGQPLLALPQMDLQEIPANRLSNYQHLQQMVQHFWKRWSTEYLCQLQQRSKRTRQNLQIAVGMLVLLKEDNLPPLKWIMGRITELHPGKDGVIRVVSVQTPVSTVRRAVSKVCVLPIDN